MLGGVTKETRQVRCGWEKEEKIHFGPGLTVRREGAGLSWENTRLGGGDVKAVGGELRAACGCGVLVVQGHCLRAHPQSLPAVLPPRSLSIWQVVWNLPEGLYRAEGCFSSTSGPGRPCSRCALQLFPGKWRKR